MKRLTTILSLILLISCGQQENKTNQATTEKVENLTTDTSHTKITFCKVNGKGILLGDNLKLLNGNFKEIKDISYLNEQFVDITEVSDKYYKIKPTDDYCQEFKYIKIKTKDFEGYVDGRKIYEPIKHFQNKIVKIDNKEVSFIATNYFGIGVSDDDGLTGCSINTPVVFSDKSVNYEGLVKMVKNENYEDNYPYFELKQDDGANDEILSIEKQGDKYLLNIKRTYQEGGANLLVEVYNDKSGTFIAEIIKNERIEE
ncbi:hypothetical protein M9Q43_13485 [Flavobacterium sp. HXWNR29]|uniref:hypothetical protein n=1 Tax=Flavobacterium odoriferum TaxID=2946604 RepID=UPI0021CB622B|nr:hypothetical protein [Flavobacterium sp. HXWNR29]MCU4190170.1 hypothetical protein [Flavobacterium sp. HXWNR29]